MTLKSAQGCQNWSKSTQFNGSYHYHYEVGQISFTAISEKRTNLSCESKSQITQESEFTNKREDKLRTTKTNTENHPKS